MRMFSLLCVVALVLSLPALAADWEDIAIPDDLAGWSVLGDGEWSAADGVAVGKAATDVNSFLMLDGRELYDFELEYEFRTPEPTNGGVQFRSHWLPKVPFEGDPAAAEHVIYGYQANLETRERVANGRIICENGRGPLAEPTMEVAKQLTDSKALTQRGWNKMRVVAMGPKIEVYIGGTLAASVEDEKYIGGYIAFQVFHLNAKQAVTEVWYRNIRLKDYGRIQEWTPLFNGENLDGWKEWGSEKWSVADRVITGSSGPKKSEGYLATEKTWEDFRVRGDFKMLGDGNFGLFFHSTITLRDDGYPIIAGVQGEVEPGWPGSTGWIYESYQRGWLEEPDHTTMQSLAMRPDAWNTIEIRSAGKVIDTWVNGIQVLHFDDPEPKLTEGSFALQLHTGGVDGIQWKNLYVTKP